MIEQVRQNADARMKKSLEIFKTDLIGVRTGKAAPAILETVKVEYYGQAMPLAQIASISAPQPRLLVVQPWDKGATEAIVKGIQAADLGLNPSPDGELIRVPIPALTEVRVSIRNVRRDANEELTKAHKDKAITEDDLHRGQKDIQKLTDDLIKRVDEALAAKEKEVLEG
jgi:ribosome recycling factor